MVVIDLWWADLTSAHLGLLDGLPDQERDRVLQLDSPADRGRRLLGAALLQQAARAHLPVKDADNEPVAVDRTCAECGGPHGRPVIHAGPWVSVAHAGHLVCVAASAHAPVGFDVEQIARFHDAADPGSAARAWVAREALVKSDGIDPGRIVPVDPPLPGYVAALQVGGTIPLEEIHVRRQHPRTGR